VIGQITVITQLQDSFTELLYKRLYKFLSDNAIPLGYAKENIVYKHRINDGKTMCYREKQKRLEMEKRFIALEKKMEAISVTK